MNRKDPISTILRPYLTADPMEQKRLSYAVYVELGMLSLFVGLTIIHTVFGMHPVHYIGDIGATISLIIALYLLHRGQEAWSGSVVIWSLVGSIFVYGLLVDRFAARPVEFLRLYVTLFSILGVFILIISIYKTFERFFWITLIFNAIIIAHTLTIMQHNRMDAMTAENWSNFLAALSTLNVAAFTTYITSRFNKELMAQNKMNLEKIHQNNIHLNQMVDSQTSELKESNERLRSFAHIASHDLKEPLRSISGFVTLIETHLRRNYPDDRTLDEYMGFVTGSTKRMGTLITDILSFSKLDTGRKEFETVDLNEILAHVLDHLSSIIDSKKAIIEYTTLPLVRGRSNLIAQVFLNLISNAIRYSRPGELPAITIRSEHKKGAVEITIHDNGIGMSPDMTTRVFMPYYLHHTADQHEDSTGMGLAICRKIIEFHGGSIWAHSVVGEGSVFHCSFPVAVAPERHRVEREVTA